MMNLGLINCFTLQWLHNGCDGVSSHQPYHFLLNRLFKRRSKKTSKLRVTGLCERNSPVIGEFPVQMASNAENVSIWWRHHDNYNLLENKVTATVYTCGTGGWRAMPDQRVYQKVEAADALTTDRCLGIDRCWIKPIYTQYNVYTCQNRSAIAVSHPGGHTHNRRNVVLT